MDKTLIIRSLDIEIEKLQQARALPNRTGSGSAGVRRGRRRGPRRMSAEARKRISDAQKKRWARRRAAQKKK
jgi:hypothetical protein